MGYQIIKQPDDLYAVFCSYSDTIVVWNASDSEIVDWFAEIAAERAREEARRILVHVATGQPERAYQPVRNDVGGSTGGGPGSWWGGLERPGRTTSRP